METTTTSEVPGVPISPKSSKDSKLLASKGKLPGGGVKAR